MAKPPDLNALREMAASDVECLPLADIETLLANLAVIKNDYDRLTAKLDAALVKRYEDEAKRTLRARGLDAGSLTMQTNDFTVKVTIPKKVEWNQARLKTIAETLKATGEDINDYISVELSVPENNYKAWPQSLKNMFEPARTVKAGKTSVKIEKKG